MTRWMDKVMNERNVFSVLRVATVAAGALGTLLALWLGMMGYGMLRFINETGALPREQAVVAACFGVLAAISGCCYAALTIFFRMCGRLALGSAFTEENARALGTIAALLLTCGALLLGALLVVELALFGGKMVLPVIYLLLFMCAFFGAALLSRALALLVRRAAALQRENELTI